MKVDILGISELKWTGMGEFDSDDISTTVGKIREKKGREENPLMMMISANKFIGTSAFQRIQGEDQLGQEELPHVRGQGWWLGGATPHLRSGLASGRS